MAAVSPVSQSRMEEITNAACQSVLSSVTTYRHAETEQWNGAIIDKILKELIAESKETHPGFKFIVNSTIIQCLGDLASSGSVKVEESVSKENHGRVGMHCATGAYWNNEKDGMWSHKFTGVRAMDVVISIMWVAI